LPCIHRDGFPDTVDNCPDDVEFSRARRRRGRRRSCMRQLRRDHGRPGRRRRDRRGVRHVPRRRERRSAHSAFRAVACELARLSGAVEAETTLGATPSPLLALLDKARAREQAAETSCVDGDPRWRRAALRFSLRL